MSSESVVFFDGDGLGDIFDGDGEFGIVFVVGDELGEFAGTVDPDDPCESCVFCKSGEFSDSGTCDCDSSVVDCVEGSSVGSAKANCPPQRRTAINTTNNRVVNFLLIKNILQQLISYKERQARRNRRVNT